jgi:hypothetical protein
MGMRKDLILSQEEIQRRKGSGRNRNNSLTKEVTNSSSRSNSLPNSESVLLTFDEIDHVSSFNIKCGLISFDVLF